MANVNVIEAVDQHPVIEDGEDLDLMDVQVAGKSVSLAGITRRGREVYLDGEIHILGGTIALIKAVKENVPYVAASTASTLFPAAWLKAECEQDADRLRIINNLERFVRTQ